ncbi:MAG: carboxypeptidase-like regulatory domain-containing protein [Bacteroidota bacterium]
MKVRLTLLFLFFATFGFSQQREFIEGKLVDGKTKEPIAFGTIRVKNKAKGVISNLDGSFKIPMVFQEIGDTLQISSLGYRTKEVVLSDLKVSDIVVIGLVEEIEQLTGVVITGEKTRVTPFSARKIIRKAISNIPNNYPFFDFSLVGYYRDYQLRDENYLNLNEAVLEVFDRGFGFKDSYETMTRIYRYDQNKDFVRDSIASKPYNYDDKSKVIHKATLYNPGGNEFALLRVHDAIRNYNVNTYSFVNNLERDFEENHNFYLEPDTFIDDIPLYVIRVTKEHKETVVEGKIYISKDDFAIHKMAYAVYQHAIIANKENEKWRLSQGAPTKKLGELVFDVNVEYRKYNKEMYLNYISFRNKFVVKEPPKFMISSVEVNNESRCFEVNFNNTPSLSSANKKAKYKLSHKGKRLKIDRISIKNNSAFLYPSNKNLPMGVGDDQIKFDLKIKNIKDVDGNELDKFTFYQAYQFREFFVQEIRPKGRPPKDNLFMVMDRPVFKNQPLVKIESLDDYWMNTPLQRNR